MTSKIVGPLFARMPLVAAACSGEKLDVGRNDAVSLSVLGLLAPPPTTTGVCAYPSVKSGRCHALYGQF